MHTWECARAQTNKQTNKQPTKFRVCRQFLSAARAVAITTASSEEREELHRVSWQPFCTTHKVSKWQLRCIAYLKTYKSANGVFLWLSTQTLPRLHLHSKCHAISRYARKCIFFFHVAHKKSAAFPITSCARLKTTDSLCADLLK